MKTYFLFLLLGSLSLTGTMRLAKAQEKSPFGIPNGTLTYEIPEKGEVIKFSFSQYGRKFRSDYYNKQNRLYQVDLYDGDTLYSFLPERRTIETLGPIRNLNGFFEASEKTLKSKPKFKQGVDINFGGKLCRQYSYFNSMLKSTKTVCCWNDIEIALFIDGKLYKKAVGWSPVLPAAALFDKKNLR